ncbi:MAG: S41 family peptidase [Bacteroidota bacterium]
MTKTNPRLLIAVGLVVAIMAFGAGTFTGMGIGRGAFFTNVAKVAQITSGTFEHRKDVNIPPITNLNALEVIWEVREKVKQQFVYPIKDDKKLTYGAVRGMLASLDDPYTRFLEPDEFKDFRTDNSGHFDGIGAVLEAKADDKTGHDDIIISSVLPEGPASKTNLRAGDIVLKVDSTLVDGMTLTNVVKLIRGVRGTPVTLTVLRKGSEKPIEIKIIRANVEVKVVEYKMLDPDKKIGYIWLRQFNQNAVKEMRTAVDDLTKQGMKGLVLDLSMDPGGLLDVAVEIGSMFIDHGPIVWTKNRGEEARSLNAIPGNAIDKNVKIVTLIDGGSASASEIVAGALQDTGRATLVGQRSFGKAKVQTICELQDDSALFLSTALYLTPKMRDISIRDEAGKRGLKPEVLLPEPDPNKTDLKYKDWHDSQIDQAKVELLKLMK